MHAVAHRALARRKHPNAQGAQQLEGELDALVSYDDTMLTAARALGVPVRRPT
jgi:hypothetical protein